MNVHLLLICLLNSFSDDTDNDDSNNSTSNSSDESSLSSCAMNAFMKLNDTDNDDSNKGTANNSQLHKIMINSGESTYILVYYQSI